MPTDKQHRVVAAATPVFLKFGYRRVTMNDIAVAASLSRPALYLVFPGKEEIFSAVVLHLAQQLSTEAQGMTAVKTPLGKLRFVFEVWAIRSFDVICASEESKELLDSSYEFAQDAMRQSTAMFDADLVSAIKLLPTRALPRGLSPQHVAHVLSSSLIGFKRVCKTSAELREMVENLLTLTIRA